MMEENKDIPIMTTPPPAAPLLPPNTKQPPEKRMTKERQKLERDFIRINSQSSLKIGGGPSPSDTLLKMGKNPNKDQMNTQA